jgi:hypothetical protein
MDARLPGGGGLRTTFTVIAFSALAFVAEARVQEGPEEVHVGTYMLRLSSMSMRDHQFSIDFYLWFRWQNPSIKPDETFEIVNGSIDRKEVLEKKRVKGMQYACLRVQATITKYWDISGYPFDSHAISVELEDSVSQERELKFVADAENVGLDEGFTVTGWRILGSAATVTSHAYRTNYGDTNDPPGQETFYSRYVHAVSMKRPSLASSVKMFYLPYLATIIAIASLLVRATNHMPRFGLQMSAIAAVVIGHLIVASGLPESGQMTIAEAIHVAAGLTILLTMGESLLSLKLEEKSRTEAAAKVDRVALFVLALVFVALNVWAGLAVA